MLTTAIIASFLLSFASTAAIGEPQQPLVQNGTNPALEHAEQAGFQRFPIEAMSDTVFRLHHHAAKALLGEGSYVILREGEIWKRRSEIFQYLDKHNLDCQEWMDAEMEMSQENGRKIFMSGGRIFDADPERVPQDVIAALCRLMEQEHENARDMRRQELCNTTQADSGYGKMASEDGLNEDRAATDQSWAVTIPDEYMQYRISEADLDAIWEAREDQDRRKILAGELSVRDVEMPDLRKCKKAEGQAMHRFH
ncbi:hypothetical protein QM012_005091 [Aureobasidium pullulans]|uniref:Uncharacterized protein n=1 Tax=Aureobasidium pullulans TaxID=5580 RepID=A0ABR0T5H5_AURPU